MSRGASCAVEVSALTKRYPGGVKALAGLSFAVEPATVFGLLGPNGAGKTTAVKILTTLAMPDSGNARVLGFDVAREAAEVRRRIGVTFQRSGADQEATGGENLMLQGRVYGMQQGELTRRVGELLRQFDLHRAAERLVRTYSGGMRRKLDIAMALLHGPSVLFLDEPTAGLDPEARAELWSQVSALTENGTTVLLTTHYLEEADKLAHRLAIIDRGRAVAEGSPDALKAQLRGDALHLELDESVEASDIERMLAGLHGLHDVVLDGKQLRARAEDGGAALPVVLATLDTEGVGIASATVARPTLDDVYLLHAGRSFRQAQGGGA